MSDYPIPNLDEVTRRGLEIAQALVPGIDTSPNGIVYRDTKAFAVLVQDLHAHLQAVDRDATPLTAEGEALEQWGRMRGVERKGPTASVRGAALEVTGAAGAPVPSGLVLRERATGVEIETTSLTVLDARGRGLVDVRSISVGARANVAAGAALDFLAPPDDIDQSARLVRNLRGAEDEESPGAYRARIVNRFQQPPQGGNQNDIEQWALTVAGVDDAHALRHRAGVGLVDVVGLRSGQGVERIISDAKREQIAAAIEARHPLGGSVRVIEAVPEVLDITVEITPLASRAYRFDWDDGARLTVADYDAANRVVTMDAPLPAQLDAGARVVFSDDGRVYLVAALVSATQFVLGTDDPELLSYAPAAGTELLAGGPLTENVRQAVLNGYRAPDGTHIPGLNQLGPANEGARYGSWLDAAESDRIAAAALSVAGVYRAQVTQLDRDGLAAGPSARPTEPATVGVMPEETRTIGLLVADRVLVRRASI